MSAYLQVRLRCFHGLFWLWAALNQMATLTAVRTGWVYLLWMLSWFSNIVKFIALRQTEVSIAWPWLSCITLGFAVLIMFEKIEWYWLATVTSYFPSVIVNNGDYLPVEIPELCLLCPVWQGVPVVATMKQSCRNSGLSLFWLSLGSTIPSNLSWYSFCLYLVLRLSL